LNLATGGAKVLVKVNHIIDMILDVQLLVMFIVTVFTPEVSKISATGNNKSGSS